ncbi:MAG: DUF5687 family protein, partial [Cyclobacteriaceae bacterium]
SVYCQTVIVHQQMLKFLQHQWLQFRRSPSFSREVGVTILIGVMAVFVTLGVIALALIFPRMIADLAGEDSINLVNKAVIYYFILEFIMRYLIQKVPALDIEPYLTLPISRKKISLFLLIRSFFSLFNIYPVILITPLAVQMIAPEFGAIPSIAWMLGILCISWSIHFLQLMFKNKYEDKPWIWIFLIGAAALNYASDYWFGFDLLKPFSDFLISIIHSPLLSLIPFGLLILTVFRTYIFLTENLYLDEITVRGKNERERYSGRLEFLTRRGLPEVFMLQEIRLILRHKRTRSVIILSLLADSPGIFVFAGIFMSVIFTINYGQFFWGWNTNQLDFFFSRPIMLKTWITSRYRLLVMSAVVSTLLCLPYLYFGWEVLLTLFCCSLFNIGVNIPLMMRLAMWQPKPIDLNRGSFMNYQGTGLAQWIMGIPLIALPFLVYLPVKFVFGYIAGILAIGLSGLISFMFRDYILSLLVNRLRKYKYQLIRDLIL